MARIHVFALGLYVQSGTQTCAALRPFHDAAIIRNKQQSKKSLPKQQQQKAREEKSDQQLLSSLCATLLSAEQHSFFARSLLLVFARSVSSDQVSAALAESLKLVVARGFVNIPPICIQTWISSFFLFFFRVRPPASLLPSHFSHASFLHH